MRRTKRALAAVVMTGGLLGLGGAASGGVETASAAQSDQPTGTASGTVTFLKPAKKFVTCANDGGYVERGYSQAFPRLDWEADEFILTGPVIAWSTEPYVWGSRAVVSMFITVSDNTFDSDSNPRPWKVSWYCTSDKSKAWLVLGAARVDVLPRGATVIRQRHALATSHP